MFLNEIEQKTSESVTYSKEIMFHETFSPVIRTHLNDTGSWSKKVLKCCYGIKQLKLRETRNGLPQYLFVFKYRQSWSQSLMKSGLYLQANYFSLDCIVFPHNLFSCCGSFPNGDLKFFPTIKIKFVSRNDTILFNILQQWFSE